MTLAEMSADYRHSAKLLSARLHELREALKVVKDPEEKWRIERRIADLTPMLTQMNELAELTAKYYERGHWRHGKYSSNSFREGKPRAIYEADEDHPERAYGAPAGYSDCVRYARDTAKRVRSSKRRKQIHSKPHPSESNTEDTSLLAVLMNAEADMIALLLNEEDINE